MRTNADKTFEELIEGLTPLQLDWLSKRLDSKSDREASREAGICKDQPGRWKAEGIPLDDIVAAAKQDGVILVKRRLERDVNWAYDVKREGLRSRSETIRQTTASEILDRTIGRATQKQAVDVTTKGESLNEGRFTDERHARAMVSLLDAFRAGLLRPDSDEQGAMDTG